MSGANPEVKEPTLSDSPRVMNATVALLAAMVLPWGVLWRVHVAVPWAGEADWDAASRALRLFLALGLPLWLGLWGVLAALWWRRELPSIPSARRLAGIPILLLVGAAFAPVALSDDLFRYLWEARVILSGRNPYSLAPWSPELADLARRYPAILARVNHPEYSAIYPPLPQGLNALVVALGLGGVGIKLVFVALAIGAAELFRRWLALRRLPTGRALLLLAHPLLAVEVGFSGHLDVLLLAGVVAVLYGLELLHQDSARRRGLSWTAGGVAAAILTKLAPAVLLLHLLMHVPGWWRRGVLMLAVAGLCVLAYLPFAGAGERLFSSLKAYNQVWESNGAFYPYLDQAFRERDPDGDRMLTRLERLRDERGLTGWERFLFVEGHPQRHPGQVAARAILTAVFALLWLAAFLPDAPFERRWLWIVGGGLLLSPVVHPWYLLALLPMALAGGAIGAGTLWWSGAVLFTYVALPQWWTDRVWHLPEWLWWLQYPGAAAVALLAAGVGKLGRLRP